MDILVVAQWCLFQVKDFQFPMLCQRAGAQEAVKKHSQDSWSELAKGIFHTTKCYVQCINEEGVGQDLQVVRNCIVHNLFLLSFLPLSLSLFHYKYYYCYYYILRFFNYKTVLSSTHKFYFFSDSPPHPPGQGVSKQLHSTCLLAGVKPWHQQNKGVKEQGTRWNKAWNSKTRAKWTEISNSLGQVSS